MEFRKLSIVTVEREAATIKSKQTGIALISVTYCLQKIFGNFSEFDNDLLRPNNLEGVLRSQEHHQISYLEEMVFMTIATKIQVYFVEFSFSREYSVPEHWFF
ncbi:hypothetical protein PHOSAC3_120919 [Mesotoga infera]|nr:hypothetical protein PHOSAC3_120919 [Mesotoga infera]